MYIHHKYILHGVDIIFRKVSFISDTLYARVRETMCVGRVKLYAEASELLTHAVFQLVVFRKTASSECILQGSKKVEVCWC